MKISNTDKAPSFGSRMKFERKMLDLTQTEFSALGGLTKRAQATYENDQRSPTAKYLQKIFAAGVDIQYLVTGIRSRQLDINEKWLTTVIEAVLTPLENENQVLTNATDLAQLIIRIYKTHDGVEDTDQH